MKCRSGPTGPVGAMPMIVIHYIISV